MPANRTNRSSSERDDRKSLFQGARTSKKKPSSTASEAQSIAQSLKRTQNLLQNELNRVNQVADTIEHDGKLLETTKQEYESLDTKSAKKALTSLQRAQQQEQRVLMASVVFFLTVVAYILWERILIKLPFVERVLKWMVANLLGGPAKGALDQALQWGKEGFQVAMVKGHELMEQIQERIDAL